MKFFSSKQKGNLAEKIAREYLEKKGLTFITQNFSCPQGEIDLVMRDSDTLVFVEVRYREKTDYGSPIETIDWHKQQRLKRTAEYYLQIHDKNQEYFWRYDWLGITRDLISQTYKIQWLTNALEETE